jgi:hypothetical protein
LTHFYLCFTSFIRGSIDKYYSSNNNNTPLNLNSITDKNDYKQPYINETQRQEKKQGSFKKVINRIVESGFNVAKSKSHLTNTNTSTSISLTSNKKESQYRSSFELINGFETTETKNDAIKLSKRNSIFKSNLKKNNSQCYIMSHISSKLINENSKKEVKEKIKEYFEDPSKYLELAPNIVVGKKPSGPKYDEKNHVIARSVIGDPRLFRKNIDSAKSIHNKFDGNQSQSVDIKNNFLSRCIEVYR